MIRWLCCACVLTLAAPALAQKSGGKGLPFVANIDEAVAQAKKSQRPLLIYIEGDLDERDERDDDARRKALQNPSLVYAARHFVPVRAIRSHSGMKDLFRRLAVPEKVTYLVIYATPAGEKFDDFRDVHLAENFADATAAAFKKYRKQLFETELKPALTEGSCPDAEVKRIMKLIEDFTIVEADSAVVEYLGKRGVSEAVAKPAYAALAELSTKDAVAFMIAQATEEAGRQAKLAEESLSKCTPKAAELMLDQLGGDDMKKARVAYKAITKICAIKNPKPDTFWDKADPARQNEEVARVKKDVEKAAKRWSEKYADYR